MNKQRPGRTLIGFMEDCLHSEHCSLSIIFLVVLAWRAAPKAEAAGVTRVATGMAGAAGRHMLEIHHHRWVAAGGTDLSTVCSCCWCDMWARGHSAAGLLGRSCRQAHLGRRSREWGAFPDHLLQCPPGFSCSACQCPRPAMRLSCCITPASAHLSPSCCWPASVAGPAPATSLTA
jgi:hypothetical protein